MESLRNEPVYLGGQPGTGGTPVVINTPTGNDGLGGGGLLSTVVLASLLGRNGLGGNGPGGTCEPSASFAFAQRAADNSSQLLAGLGKAEGDIKESFNAGLHRNQIETAAHFTALMNRSCDVEKEAIKANYEGRLADLQSKADILSNANSNTMSIKDDIKDFRFDVDGKFCHLNNSIDKQFCRLDHELDRRFACVDKQFDNLREGELKRENRELREKIDSIRDREQSRDIRSIESAVEKILCGLAKVPAPANLPSNILDGCGKC